MTLSNLCSSCSRPGHGRECHVPTYLPITPSVIRSCIFQYRNLPITLEERRHRVFLNSTQQPAKPFSVMFALVLPVGIMLQQKPCARANVFAYPCFLLLPPAGTLSHMDSTTCNVLLEQMNTENHSAKVFVCSLREALTSRGMQVWKAKYGHQFATFKDSEAGSDYGSRLAATA